LFSFALPVAVLAYLAWRFTAHQSTMAVAAGWQAAWLRFSWPLAGAAMLLAAVNWGLEAWKWRLALHAVEPMGPARAMAATLAGTTVGLFTPNRSGEGAGRLLFLAPRNRWQGGVSVLLCGMAQFTVTMTAGSVALLWWLHAHAGPWSGTIFTGLATAAVVLVAAGAAALCFRPALVMDRILRLPLLHAFRERAALLKDATRRTAWQVLALSLLRYAVFAVQYAWLLAALAAVPWGTGLWAVPFLFLVTTLVPTMVLSDLGVRGSVAVAMLVPAGHDPAPVLLAAFLLWVVNLALPAAVGGLLLMFHKARRT
jgi:hypothetical protein